MINLKKLCTGYSFIILVFIFALNLFLIIIFEDGQRDLILGSGRNVKMYGFTHFPFTGRPRHTGGESLVLNQPQKDRKF